MNKTRKSSMLARKSKNLRNLFTWSIWGILGMACGESASELYFRGMQIEGDASRHECKLVYDHEANAHLIDGDQVLSCLRRTEEALALYEKAAAMGQRGLQFTESRERAQARKQKLESMLKVIRGIEQEQVGASR